MTLPVGWKEIVAFAIGCEEMVAFVIEVGARTEDAEVEPPLEVPC